MTRKRMPVLRVPASETQARLDEVNAFLKHVDHSIWALPDAPVMSLGGLIVYVFLTDRRTGITHTFNRFDADGVAELERMTTHVTA